MVRLFVTDLGNDVADRSDHYIWWDTTVIAVLCNNLASACGKPRQARLHFMNPHLLICRGLSIWFRVSKIERFSCCQDNHGTVSETSERPGLIVAFGQDNSAGVVIHDRLWLLPECCNYLPTTHLRQTFTLRRG